MEPVTLRAQMSKLRQRDGLPIQVLCLHFSEGASCPPASPARCALGQAGPSQVELPRELSPPPPALERPEGGGTPQSVQGRSCLHTRKAWVPEEEDPPAGRAVHRAPGWPGGRERPPRGGPKGRGPRRVDSRDQGSPSLCRRGPRGSWLRLAGHLWSLSHIFFFLQSFKNMKTILISRVVRKQAAGGM